jgi:hypothetical protein
LAGDVGEGVIVVAFVVAGVGGVLGGVLEGVRWWVEVGKGMSGTVVYKGNDRRTQLAFVKSYGI